MRPKTCGRYNLLPGGPVAHPATIAVTTTRPGISGTSRHTHDPTPRPPGHSPIPTLQSLRRRSRGGPAAGRPGLARVHPVGPGSESPTLAQLLERTPHVARAPAVLARPSTYRQSGKFCHPLNRAVQHPAGPHSRILAGRAIPLFPSAPILGSSARSKILLDISSACSPGFAASASSTSIIPKF